MSGNRQPAATATSVPPDGQKDAVAAAPMLPDLDSSDTDSALGESITGSESTTIASSIRNYVYENGRRYHAFREGAYLFPNDEAEQERLDLLHHIFRLILGGALSRAPNFVPTASKRILDLGCGTGIWAIEAADELPEATIVGTDLSPIQPTWVPPNCNFYVDDMESPWNYRPDEHFDLIHGRALCGSVSDWPKLITQAYDNLNPGGYLEIQDYYCHLYSDDGTYESLPDLVEWVENVTQAAENIGKSLRITNKVKQMMQNAGFEDVQEEIYKVPIGTWAKGTHLKQLGMTYRAQFLQAVEPFTLALYTRVLGYSEKEAHAVVARVKKDLVTPQVHIYAPFYFIWGRKPAARA